MHTCPDCGQACYCDGEDMDNGESYCRKHSDCLEEFEGEEWMED